MLVALLDYMVITKHNSSGYNGSTICGISNGLTSIQDG